MTKYKKLGAFLDQQEASHIPMTFSEIEHVIGCPLPRSSRYPAWWSNNPTNNVMTKIWLKAGFKTEHVNVEGRKLVFRRVAEAAPSRPPTPSGMADASRSYVAMDKGVPAVPGQERPHPIHPAFGSMKGLITVAPGVDLTAPAADPKAWKFHR